MIHVLKEKYFSKAYAFILPLTGLLNNRKFNIKTYLFWEDYSIEDFHLVVTYSYENKEEFIDYCRKFIFPILDKKGYLIENYDFENQAVIKKDKKTGEIEVEEFKYLSVFVLDISEWSMDVTMFLNGKYSKLSKEAKKIIEEFHKYYVKDEARWPIHIYSALYPNEPIKTDKGEPAILDKLSPIEYVAKNYEINLSDLQKIGELGSIYDIDEETLTIGQKKEEISEGV